VASGPLAHLTSGELKSDRVTNSDAMKNVVPLLLLASLGTACGGAAEDQAAPESTPAEAAPSVTILAPVDGAFQDEKDVTVWLRSTVPIVPAGDMTPGTGHHHLYLDADLGDITAPIPTVPGSIVHMGDGSSEYLFVDVASGPHRLIAVVADGAHVPLQPLVADTVEFVVE
jgi:hypothetical protein